MKTIEELKEALEKSGVYEEVWIYKEWVCARNKYDHRIDEAFFTCDGQPIVISDDGLRVYDDRINLD